MRGGRRLASGAARFRGVLDVAVGAARPGHGDATDRVPRRAREACAGSRRRDAHGRHARAAPSMATTSACWPAIRARPPTSSSGTSRPSPRAGVRRPAAAGAQLRGARPPGAPALARRRNGRHRRDAGAAGGRRGVDPAPAAGHRARPPDASPARPARTAARPGLRGQRRADELASRCSPIRLDDLPIEIEVATTRLLASELVALVHAQGVSIVCLADLPPSPSSKTRYLVKRLRAALPDVRILVGRWAPGAGGRQHAGAAGCRRESGGLDAGGDADVPDRAGGDSRIRRRRASAKR